jgi:hypothetical protein
VFLNITVRPLQQEEGKPQLTLVVFDEVEESMRIPEGEPADAARELLIGQLEEEIRQLKLHLQDTIETRKPPPRNSRPPTRSCRPSTRNCARPARSWKRARKSSSR